MNGVIFNKIAENIKRLFNKRVNFAAAITISKIEYLEL